MPDGAEPYTTETWTCLTAIWDTYQGSNIGSNDNDDKDNTRSQEDSVGGASRSRPALGSAVRRNEKDQQQTVIEDCGRSTATSVSVTLQQDCIVH
jgi:hypothetical protein